MVTYNPNLIDADTDDFIARQKVNGGAGCSVTTKFFVNAFIRRLKDTGVWPQISRCNIFVGPDIQSAMTPLKVGGGNSIETYNFVSGDYSEATGLQGNGTSKYMRTGLTPSAAGMTVNDGHLACYMNVASSGAGAIVDIGVKSDTSTRFSQLYHNALNLVGRIGTNSGDSQYTVPTRLGWASVNAISSKMNFAYNGKSLFQPSVEVSTGGALASLEYYVCARNELGSATAFYSNGRYCFYSIGLGLTKQQISDYRDAVQRLQSNLGRAYRVGSLMCWGDSLTAGTGGTPWPTDLATLYSNYFVYNGGIGGDTSSQILTRFNDDPAAMRDQPCIIWAGRNDVISPGPTTVKANIATMVAALQAAGNRNRYLILSVPNKDTEFSGSADYTTVVGLNSDLASIYGANYLDIRSYLVGLYDQNNATDVTNHSQDIPPSTLRFDTVHFNTAGYQKIADKIAAVTGALGWWP